MSGCALRGCRQVSWFWAAGPRRPAASATTAPGSSNVVGRSSLFSRKDRVVAVVDVTPRHYLVNPSNEKKLRSEVLHRDLLGMTRSCAAPQAHVAAKLPEELLRQGHLRRLPQTWRVPIKESEWDRRIVPSFPSS